MLVMSASFASTRQHAVILFAKTGAFGRQLLCAGARDFILS